MTSLSPWVGVCIALLTGLPLIIHASRLGSWVYEALDQIRKSAAGVPSGKSRLSWTLAMGLMPWERQFHITLFFRIFGMLFVVVGVVLIIAILTSSIFP